MLTNLGSGGTGLRYQVRCYKCEWRGYRKDSVDCECYEDYAYYCRPASPGPGCPRGIVWPCPKGCKPETGWSTVYVHHEIVPKPVLMSNAVPEANKV